MLQGVWRKKDSSTFRNMILCNKKGRINMERVLTFWDGVGLFIVFVGAVIVIYGGIFVNDDTYFDDRKMAAVALGMFVAAIGIMIFGVSLGVTHR